VKLDGIVDAALVLLVQISSWKLATIAETLFYQANDPALDVDLYTVSDLDFTEQVILSYLLFLARGEDITKISSAWLCFRRWPY
jgi:hypothetical protein